MFRNNIHGIFRIVIVSAAFTLLSGPIEAADYTIHYNPKGYVLDKFQSHDLVLLGTRHKREPILQFISDLIPTLHDAGVSHIGLEISSDQQEKIDHFIETGTGLADIEIHPQLDCPGYRDLLKQIRGLDDDKRPDIIAIDLPKSQYGQMSRDEYMAESIAGVFQKIPSSKMLIFTGNNHVLKKLDWEDHVPNKNRSIRSYLTELVPILSVFTIGYLIDENPGECDFTSRFAHMDGSVAMDCDNSFRGWNLGITRLLLLNQRNRMN